MAIKRLKMNDDGEFEERKLEKSELPPPPPAPEKPAARPRAPRIGASQPRDGSDGAGSSRVKVTQRATKRFAAGKTVMDHDMVRFECKRCGSSRVGKEDSKGFLCSLCAVPMQRVTR